MAREWENYIASFLDSLDIPYVREVNFGGYRADFVLVGLDIVLEIDGPEHHAQTQQRMRDHEKEELYHNAGFTVLRIRHKDLDRALRATEDYLLLCILRRKHEYAFYFGT